MRLTFGFVFAIVFIATWAMHVNAMEFDRQLRQQHMIELEVECLDTAIEIIRELNGFNLDVSVFTTEQHGREVRRANFTRRVDAWAFRHVQEILRELGEVTSESESAQHLGAQIMDVDVRIAAISQEIERLNLMMAASDSLDILIMIDAHLSGVMRDRDSLIGTRNLLLSQANNPVINIQLHEIPEDMPVPVPPTFGSRIVGSFMTSFHGLQRISANLLVFIVRVSIPLVIWLVILGVVGSVVFRVRKKKGVKHLEK
ncbi:MAG: DUF4349 domain-containing protein [Defluviitaleaceae bacterium]|nr:DUF4349 domain-containing protein [Defluviitaleaceae bacterium]